MTLKYTLVHWDESGGDWTLHLKADGTEIGGPWSEEPSEKQIRAAIGEYDLPGDANLPSAARQAQGMAEVMTAEWYGIKESHPRFPPW